MENLQIRSFRGVEKISPCWNLYFLHHYMSKLYPWLSGTVSLIWLEIIRRNLEISHGKFQKYLSSSIAKYYIIDWSVKLFHLVGSFIQAEFENSMKGKKSTLHSYLISSTDDKCEVSKWKRENVFCTAARYHQQMTHECSLHTKRHLLSFN